MLKNTIGNKFKKKKNKTYSKSTFSQVKSSTPANNKLGLSLLIITYFLFGTAPLYLVGLRQYSAFSLAFYRFFWGSIIELIALLIISAVFYQKFVEPTIRKDEKQKLRNSLRFLKNLILCYLKGSLYENEHNETGRANDEDKNKKKNKNIDNKSKIIRKKKDSWAQFRYLMITAFILVPISVPALYLSYNLNGLIFTTIATNCTTILIITIWNRINHEEDIDLLKIVYLLLVVAAIITVAFSSTENNGNQLSSEGILIQLLSILTYTLFLHQVSHDPGQNLPLTFTYIQNPIVEKIDSNILEARDKNAHIMVALMKLAIVHFIGGLMVVPTVWLLAIMFPKNYIGIQSANFFLDMPWNFQMLIESPALWGLIILSTIAPYFMLIYSAAIWPKHALKHDLWTGILSNIDPLVSVYLGYFVWKEPIRFDYIIFTTIFLGATIVLRYFYESAETRHVVIWLKYNIGNMEKSLMEITKFKELDNYYVLAGEYDAVARFTIRTMAQLDEISEKLNNMKFIHHFNISIEKRY